MEYNNSVGYEIKESIIQGNGTYIAYPILTSEAKNEKLDVWNNIILQDIGRILRIYSAYTFTSPPKEEEPYLPNTLHVTYEIKRNDSKYLSILYRADFYSPYAAYPTQMIYTTNIDKDNDRRLRLSDFIINQSALTDDITPWEIVDKNHENGEYYRAIHDYIKGLGKEILQMGFKFADIIGPDNYLGIYSYLIPNKLGISLSVPNYLGDHVEYERAIVL